MAKNQNGFTINGVWFNQYVVATFTTKDSFINHPSNGHLFPDRQDRAELLGKAWETANQNDNKGIPAKSEKNQPAKGGNPSNQG